MYTKFGVKVKLQSNEDRERCKKCDSKHRNDPNWILD